MASDGEFTFERAVCVTGGDMQYRVTIPNKHLKLLGDDQYVHLSTVPSFSAALFGVYKNHIAAAADARNRPMSKTDIIQQLIDLRNSNIDTMMAAIAGGEPTESLFEAKSAKRFNLAQRLQMPSTIVIQAPTIGEIAGVPMRCTAGTKRDPMFVELTSDNIKYLRAVCNYQIASGKIKRHVHEKRRMKIHKRKRRVPRVDDAKTEDYPEGVAPVCESQASVPEAGTPCDVASEPVTPTKQHRDRSITSFFKRFKTP